MSTINPIGQTGNTQDNTATSSTRADGNDGLGRDAFLQLLVTQLQHQDPTQPQADGEFIAQLAQFSSLEQLTSMRQSLDSMAAGSDSTTNQQMQARILAQLTQIQQTLQQIGTALTPATAAIAAKAQE